MAVHAQFQCRGCGRLAPLDAVEPGGLAWCASCALTQAVDPGTWPAGLAFAHAVGDLAGGEGLHPHPSWSILGENPHAGVVTDRAVETLVLDGTGRVDGLEVRRSLRLRAAPGHPLCEACHGVLQVDVPGAGQVRTRCLGCGVSARFDVPAGVLAASPGLRGVIADAYLTGLKEARTAESGGILALSCPGCGAPLKVDGHAYATCGFCHLVCRLPVTRGVGAQDVPPVPFWLVFGGPAAKRAQLERHLGPAEQPPLEIALPPVAPAPLGLGTLVGLVPAALVAGAMALVTGAALFGLMQLGVLRL